MGGADTVRALRKLVGGLPLIVGMTGDPSGCDDRKEFEAAGLDACLDKNSSGTEALVEILREHARSLARNELAARRFQIQRT